MAPQQDDPVINIGVFRNIRLHEAAGGRWEVRWTDASGPRQLTRRESCRTTRHDEAQAYLGAFIDGARQVAAQVAAPLVAAPLRIRHLCEHWLDEALRAGKHRSHRHLITPLVQAFGDLTADQLTRAMLRDYRTARGKSDGTLRREIGLLGTILRWAEGESLIEGERVNIEGLFRKALPPVPTPREKYLERDEADLFWTQAVAWAGDDTKAGAGRQSIGLFVAIAMETAARREAIMQLTWDRVVFARGYIDFRVPGARVTKKRRGPVPISNRLRPILEAAALWAPIDALGRPQGPVLAGGRGHIERGFRVFAREAGMEWVTPHVLRHTWGSLAAMAGVSLYNISQVMHDRIKTIESNYLHLTPERLAEAVNWREAG